MPIDPIRFPVAAAEAATRAQIQNRAAYQAAVDAGTAPRYSPPRQPPRQPPGPIDYAAQRRMWLASAEHRWGDVRDTVLAAAREHDDIERLLLAARHWMPRLDAYSPLSQAPIAEPSLAQTDAYLWSAAFPDVWPDPDAVLFGRSEPAWDSAAVADWVAAQWRAQGRKPTLAYGKARFGVFPKRKGWSVRHGASHWHTGSINGVSPPAPYSVTIARNGEIVGRAGIGMFGLQELAVFCQLSDDRMQLPR